MKPANQMISDISKPIQELCNKFVKDYTNDQTSLTKNLFIINNGRKILVNLKK